MNEITQDSTEQIPVSITPSGKLLRDQRESRGISVEEVAQSLKLQPRQIIAMEAGDFASLGSQPFARGFVRNYARFIGFDPAQVLAGLEQQLPLPTPELGDKEGPRVSMPQPGRRKPLAWVLAVSPLLLVALAAAGFYAFGVNLDSLRFASKPATESAKPVEGESAPPVPTVAPGKTESAVAAPALVVSVAPPAAMPTVPVAPVVPVAAAPVPAPAAPAAALPGQHHLVLSVAGESWVEVKSDGRVLLSQRLAPRETRSLEGKGPFSVVIGNAQGAQAQYDEKPVDLATYTKVNVARFTLN